MKRILITTSAILISFLKLYASPDRIPDDSGPSPISIFIGCIVAIGFILLVGPGILSNICKGEADKDTKQFGCGLVVLALGVILVIAMRCS